MCHYGTERQESMEEYVRNDIKWQTEVQSVLYATHEELIFTAASRPALKVHIICFLVGKLVST